MFEPEEAAKVMAFAGEGAELRNYTIVEVERSRGIWIEEAGPSKERFFLVNERASWLHEPGVLLGMQVAPGASPRYPEFLCICDLCEEKIAQTRAEFAG